MVQGEKRVVSIKELCLIINSMVCAAAFNVALLESNEVWGT